MTNPQMWPQMWIIFSIPDGEARYTRSREVAYAYASDPECLVIDPLFWEQLRPNGTRAPLIEQTWVGGAPA